MFRNFLLVALGGAGGSVIRYAFSFLFHYKKFPFATLTVNIVGCFLIGLLLGYFSKNEQAEWRLLLATGFCGGFTTFSAFSAETVQLIRDQQWITALIYISLSVVLGVTATFVAFQMIK